MDSRRFDALVRSLVVPSSRRHLLAGLMAALVPAFGTEARRTRRGKARHKAKQRRKRRRRRTRRTASCCTGGNCTPGPGKDLTRCCFEGQDLTDASFKGATLTNAIFRGATLTDAKFQGATLTGACFVDADITGASFKGANLSGVIFCRTITDSGSDNSGCHLGTACCPTTCERDASCGGDQVCCGGTCQASQWVPQTHFGSAGNGDAQFDSPSGVAVAPDLRTIWVVDQFNERIAVWTRPDATSTDWTHQVNFGTTGTGDDQFSLPHNVVVSPDTKTVWVADVFNNRIAVWTRPDDRSTDWTPQTHFGTFGHGDAQFSHPLGVAVAPDTKTVWVADTDNNRISVWSRPDATSMDWTHQVSFGTFGTGANQFDRPNGVAVAPNLRTVWVVDLFNNRIAVWTRPDATSTDWAPQTHFGTCCFGANQFNRPSGVAVARDTLTIWVADQFNDRIAVWTRPDDRSADWAPQTHFGTFATGATQLNRPSAVAIAPDTRTVWVADEFNHRIAVWELGCPAS